MLIPMFSLPLTIVSVALSEIQKIMKCDLDNFTAIKAHVSN